MLGLLGSVTESSPALPLCCYLHHLATPRSDQNTQTPVMGAGFSSQANYDGPRNLAAKLASQQPCIVAFMSPVCGLCSSLLPALDEVRSKAARHRRLQSAALPPPACLLPLLPKSLMLLPLPILQVATSSSSSSSLQVSVLNGQQDTLWAPEVRQRAAPRVALWGTGCNACSC